jgi:Matrixin
VDRHFSNDEFLLIAAAAIRWTRATNHIIEYDVIKLPILDKWETAQPNDVIIDIVSPDYPDVISLDTFNRQSTLAYYNGRGTAPMIGIVEERIANFEDFQQVILHELGHSIGLKHNEGIEGIDTLMYPNIDLASRLITQDDLINVCKLYKCDPDQLQHE